MHVKLQNSAGSFKVDVKLLIIYYVGNCQKLSKNYQIVIIRIYILYIEQFSPDKFG